MKLSFPTKKDAINFLKSKGLHELGNSGHYWCDSNYVDQDESSSPDYNIKKYSDGYGLQINYYQYAGALFPKKNHRVNDPSHF